jgi:hypothetical protein
MLGLVLSAASNGPVLFLYRSNIVEILTAYPVMILVPRGDVFRFSAGFASCSLMDVVRFSAGFASFSSLIFLTAS